MSDAIIEDDYGDTTCMFKESWDTWEQIENWQLVKSDVFFSYAPKPAAIYILPRFMLFALDEIEGTLPKVYQGYSTGDTVVWFIEALKRKDFRNSGLSVTQISVIEKFLSFIYRDYDNSVTIDVGNKKP